MNKVITQYIMKNVNGKRQRVGVIVAGVVDGNLRYGWSLAKVKPSRRDCVTDTFDKQRGEQMALERLNSYKLTMPDTVRSVLRDRYVMYKTKENGKTVRRVKSVRGFATRAKRYFKF